MSVATVKPFARVSRQRAARHRITARDLWIAGIFAAAALFYVWTIASSGARTQFGGDPVDYYAALTTGFLHGHLSIPMLPPKALLATPDPYSPVYNAPWRSQIEDLALYHGHFYLDWGPTPVVTLYLPWRLLGLGSMTESWALGIYSVVGLGFCLLLYRSLVATYAPRARTSRIALGAVALALSNVVPFIDRTPDIYELAVGCGYCFLMIGFYLLASGGLGGRHSFPRLALGSLSLGLAAGARWDLLLAVLLLGPLFLWLVRRERPAGVAPFAKLAAVVLGPGAFVVLVLLAYNYARFGRLLEVGTTYQLAGHDPATTPYYLIGYLAPSSFYYLLAPVRWTLAFPFVVLPPPPNYPGGVPPSYYPESIGGILSTTPLLLTLFVAPIVTRRRLPREWQWITVALVADALVIVGLLAIGIPGGSMRYEVDFAPLLLFPAIVAWLVWEPQRRFLRRAAGFTGAVLVLYGAIVGLGISITGYRSQIFHTDAGQVSALQQITDPIPNLVTRVLGHPVLDSISASHLVLAPTYRSLGIGHVVYAEFGSEPLVMSARSPDNGTWTLSIALQFIGAVPPHSSVHIAVTDSAGTHVYNYTGFLSYDFPVALRQGRNGLTIRGWGTAPGLRHAALVLQCSDITLGAPEISPTVNTNPGSSGG